jgi:hypothetical protein
MALQEAVHELTIPVYRTAWLYCGHCATDRPSERLHRIGRAGGLRYCQHIDSDFLRDFMDVPGARSELEVRDPDPHPVRTPKNWRTHAKLRKIRTGVLYEVSKDSSHLSRRRLVSELKQSRFQVEPSNMTEVVDDALGFRRTTRSAHHNGMVKLSDSALSSALTCWKCGARMRVGRERLVMAVEHVKTHGGKILLTTDVEVRESAVKFEWRPHQRSRSRRLREGRDL